MATITSILGRKIGMTQYFDATTGERVGVTVIEAGPCKVLQVKTEERDRYHALQLGFGARREKSTPLPELGHFEKAGCTPRAFVREIRLDGPATHKPGDEITVEILNDVRKVDVSGLSKGKGYQGVMKRWNFRGLKASHGCSKRHRAPGALGRHQSISKGVNKGKKMAGHLGNEPATVQGLKVVKVDAQNHLLLVKGPVPGANGGFLVVRRALKENVRLARAARAK
jgi:large subunit ribosomal protein L3